MTRYSLIVALLVGLMSGLPEASAGDHDQARQLRHQGEILPLSQILSQISSRYPGRVLEVELKQRNGRPVYEIELLGRDDVVRDITVDAKSGSVMAVEDE